MKVAIDFAAITSQIASANMTDPHTPDAIPLGEILQGPSKFEQFLENNQKLLAVGAVAVALGIGGFMVMRTVREDKNAAAAGALVAATDIASLEAIRKDHAGTPAAITAEFALAQKLWESGQQDAAITTLRDLIAKHPTHTIVPIARQTLASHLLSQGKTADALTTFEEVVSDPASAYLAPSALLSLGDISTKENNKNKAKEYFERIDKEFPNSKLKQIAEDRLRFLSFEMPIEVEPPPPEPPASIALPTNTAATSTETIPPVNLLDALKNNNSPANLLESSDEEELADPTNEPASTDTPAISEESAPPSAPAAIPEPEKP